MQREQFRILHTSMRGTLPGRYSLPVKSALFGKGTDTCVKYIQAKDHLCVGDRSEEHGQSFSSVILVTKASNVNRLQGL